MQTHGKTDQDHGTRGLQNAANHVQKRDFSSKMQQIARESAPDSKRNKNNPKKMGLSENSVPLNPMVNDHYPVFKWLFHWENILFSDKPKYNPKTNQATLRHCAHI